ncbi:MAG: TIGR04283 family arsenosugar biosynthesis glycosyltransferase [Hyphomicrobiales bacterium]
MISVVIPTLNAGKSLVESLNCLVKSRKVGLISDVLISDGGSEDDTCAVAEERGVRVVSGARGRGGQLKAGAAAAQADWFLFLHADTVLQPGWEEEVHAFVDAADSQAAAFKFKLADDTPMAKALEKIVQLRCWLFALPYGDQGLLISRALYEEIGGFADIPLMEDVDIVSRIGRRRLHFFNSAAITSAARYQREGYVKRMMRNATCLSLWYCGVSPERIVRLYQ